MIIDTLRRLRPKRRIGWLWVVITAFTLVNGLRLRARVDALPRMSDGRRPTPGTPTLSLTGWIPTTHS